MRKVVVILAVALIVSLVACAAPAPSAAPAPAPAPSAAPKPAPTSASSPAPAPAPKPSTVRVLSGSSGAGTTDYNFTVEWARIMNQYVPGLDVTVVETGAAIENTERMETDEFAFTPNADLEVALLAYRGVEPFRKPLTKCRILFIRGLGIKNIVVREDSGITSLEQLNGKNFACGPTGSYVTAQIQIMFDILGIKPVYMNAGYTESANLMKDRRVVGYIKTCPITGLDPSILDILSTTKLRILSFTPEQVKKIVAKLPWTSWQEVPAGFWSKSLPNHPAYTTFFSAQCTGANKDLISEEMGYQITKACVEHVREFSSWPPLTLLDPAVDLIKSLDAMPETPWLHAGAVRYFREKGFKVPDKAIPPEMKK